MVGEISSRHLTFHLRETVWGSQPLKLHVTLTIYPFTWYPPLSIIFECPSCLPPVLAPEDLPLSPRSCSISCLAIPLPFVLFSPRNDGVDQAVDRFTLFLTPEHQCDYTNHSDLGPQDLVHRCAMVTKHGTPEETTLRFSVAVSESVAMSWFHQHTVVGHRSLVTCLQVGPGTSGFRR